MINFNVAGNYAQNKAIIEELKRQATDLGRIDFETSQNVQPKNTGNYKKIGFGEGIKLFGKGIFKQAKDIITTIIKHPLKTLAVVGGTTAALMALPLVGIPTAVGGAAMAVGFAGLAAINGAKHTAQFIRNNKEGTYDKARENLEKLGGDSVDLALSAPFVPKAIKEIKKFAKYGEISVNTQAIKGLFREKGLKAKLNVLKDANKEASRAMNYNQATEIELAKLEGITEAEKAKIKQYIKDYNVPREKIPEVVLEQWAQERSISTKPKLRYQSLKKTTLGYATPSSCQITLNDFGENIVQHTGNCNTTRYQQIGPARRNFAGKLKVDYKDIQTGEVFSEIIDAKLVDDRTRLLNESAKCSQEAQTILTTTHEREHIHQFARFYKNGENMGTLTPEAEQLYKQMAAEMEPLTPGQTEYYRQMAHYSPKRRTTLAYIAEPMEVQARLREAELLGQQRFQTLDKVFKAVNNMKDAAISAKDYILNLIRGESAAA